jgi:hypothetical protein
MSEFEKFRAELHAEMHERAARKNKKAPLAVLVKRPETARNEHSDDDVGCLAKALQAAHAAGALTGAEANRLDLLARQRRLPSNLRDALLAIDVTGGRNP